MQRVAAAAELARAADVVYLDGETPEGLRQGWLGAYERIRDPPQLVHARHAYVKRGAPQKMLWCAPNHCRIKRRDESQHTALATVSSFRHVCHSRHVSQACVERLLARGAGG